MEFLKSVFGEGALTFNEFAAVAAQNGFKLADLAAGGYVDKRKLAELSDTNNALKSTLAACQTELDEFKKVDVEALRGRIAEMEEVLRLKAEEGERREHDLKLTQQITACIGDRRFTSEYLKDTVVADIKRILAQDETRSVKQVFDEVAGDKSGFFVSRNPSVVMDGIGSPEVAYMNKNAIRHVMGLPNN